MLEALKAYRYPTEVQSALFTNAVVLKDRFSKSHSNVWRSLDLVVFGCPPLGDALLKPMAAAAMTETSPTATGTGGREILRQTAEPRLVRCCLRPTVGEGLRISAD